MKRPYIQIDSNPILPKLIVSFYLQGDWYNCYQTGKDVSIYKNYAIVYTSSDNMTTFDLSTEDIARLITNLVTALAVYKGGRID